MRKVLRLRRRLALVLIFRSTTGFTLFIEDAVSSTNETFIFPEKPVWCEVELVNQSRVSWLGGATRGSPAAGLVRRDVGSGVGIPCSPGVGEISRTSIVLSQQLMVAQ